MTHGKTGFRTPLPMLEDDPFFGPLEGPYEASPPDEGDSIFSVSRAPGTPARVDPPQATQPAASEPAQPEPVQETPAPELPRIEDPVLKVLLSHDLLKAEQLDLLMTGLQSLPAGTPPWRAALTLPGVSQEHILAVAAHVHKIPFVDLREHPVGMMMLTLESLPVSFKRQCHELGLLPFALEFGKESGQLELKLATYDPLRPEVEAFLGGVQMAVRMYYTPLSILKGAVRRLAEEHGVGE